MISAERVKGWIETETIASEEPEISEIGGESKKVDIVMNGAAFQFDRNLGMTVVIDPSEDMIIVAADIKITNILEQHIEKTGMEHVTGRIQPMLSHQTFTIREDGEGRQYFRIVDILYQDDATRTEVMDTIRHLGRTTYLIIRQIKRHEKAEENNGDVGEDPPRLGYAFR